jgi:dihydrofolate reductase
MGKVIVHMNLTLDSVIQAPTRPDEDLRGGFGYGGWATAYYDPVMSQATTEGIAEAPALLFGRRTYEDFYSVWPARSDNPFSDVLNKAQKYVASTTLREPLPWMNSTLLKGDVAQAVAALKKRSSIDITILGSGELVQYLMLHNLIDEYVLSIYPLVLGKGRRLFPEDGTLSAFELVDVKASGTGVLITTYRPAS